MSSDPKGSNPDISNVDGNGRRRVSARRPPGKLAVLRLPLLCAVGLAVVTVLVCLVLPKQYRSDTTLYFPNSDTTGGAVSQLLGAVGGGNAGSSDNKSMGVPILGNLLTAPQVASGPDTAITILSSIRANKEVVKRCDLMKRWKRTKLSDALKKLDKESTFSVNKNGLLQIEIQDKDPKLASDIANAFVTALKNLATELSTAYSKQVYDFMVVQVQQQRDDLSKDQRRMVRLQSRLKPAMPPSIYGPKIADAYLQLEAQKEQSTLDLKAAQAALDFKLQSADATLRKGSDLPGETIVAKKLLGDLRDSETQLALSEATEGPDNPHYRLVKDQTEAARKAVVAEVRRKVSALKIGIDPDTAVLFATRDSTRARLDGALAAIDEVKDQMNGLPSLGMREEELRTDLTIGRTNLQQLVLQTALAKIAEQRDIPTFVTIDEPEVATDPAFPNTPLATALAFVVGLLLGAAWQVTRALRQAEARTSEQLSSPAARTPVEAG